MQNSRHFPTSWPNLNRYNDQITRHVGFLGILCVIVKEQRRAHTPGGLWRKFCPVLMQQYDKVMTTSRPQYDNNKGLGLGLVLG